MSRFEVQSVNGQVREDSCSQGQSGGSRQLNPVSFARLETVRERVEDAPGRTERVTRGDEIVVDDARYQNGDIERVAQELPACLVGEDNWCCRWTPRERNGHGVLDLHPVGFSRGECRRDRPAIVVRVHGLQARDGGDGKRNGDRDQVPGGRQYKRIRRYSIIPEDTTTGGAGNRLVGVRGLMARERTFVVVRPAFTTVSVPVSAPRAARIPASTPERLRTRHKASIKTQRTDRLIVKASFRLFPLLTALL